MVTEDFIPAPNESQTSGRADGGGTTVGIGKQRVSIVPIAPACGGIEYFDEAIGPDDAIWATLHADYHWSIAQVVCLPPVQLGCFGWILREPSIDAILVKPPVSADLLRRQFALLSQLVERRPGDL